MFVGVNPEATLSELLTERGRTGQAPSSNPFPLTELSDLLAMPSADKKLRTLYDKVFQDHIVDERDDGTILLYIGERTYAANVYPGHSNVE